MNSGSQEPPPSGRSPLVLAKGQQLLGAEPAQHIFKHPRHIVFVVIVREAATEGDRSGRKNCAITDRLKIDDLGTDQRLRPLTVNRRHVGEQFLRHDDKVALMFFGTRQDYSIGRRPEFGIGAVEFEPGGTTAREAEIADDLVVNACEYPRSAVVGSARQTAVVGALEQALGREPDPAELLWRSPVATP